MRRSGARERLGSVDIQTEPRDAVHWPGELPAHRQTRELPALLPVLRRQVVPDAMPAGHVVQ